MVAYARHFERDTQDYALFKKTTGTIPISGTTGYTMGVWVRRTQNGIDPRVLVLEGASGGSITLNFDTSNRPQHGNQSGHGCYSPTTVSIADGLCFIGVGHSDARAGYPRFHVYKGGLWYHDDALGTTGFGGPATISGNPNGFMLGGNTGSANYDGEILAAGFWNTDLADATVEAEVETWEAMEASSAIWAISYNQSGLTPAIQDVKGDYHESFNDTSTVVDEPSIFFDPAGPPPIAYVESTSVGSTSSNTRSVTFDNIPADGNVIWLVIHVQLGLNATTPDGFAVFGPHADEINQAKLYAFRRVASDEASATYTVNLSGTETIWYMAGVVLSGVDNTTPEDTAPVFGHAYAGSDNLAPAITSVTPNAMHLAVVVNQGSDATAQTPAGYTMIEPQTSGAIGYKLIPAAATDTGTVNITDTAVSYPSAVSILLRPGASLPPEEEILAAGVMGGGARLLMSGNGRVLQMAHV